MESDWLVKEGQIIIYGQIYPGWRLKRGLRGIIERDQAGHYYFISNEDLGLYAVGFSREEALEDFKTTLIDNYQRLEAQAADDFDLKVLVWEYQKYLERVDLFASG